MVHPAIELSEKSPSSHARGLVITLDQSLDEITGVPLILLPEDLVLSSDVAREGFLHYESREALPAADLDDATCLSLLLSHEQVVDREDSFYKPYIDCLPSSPPCAWLHPSLASREIDVLVNHGRLSEEKALKWKEEVRNYLITMEAHAEGIEKRYGKFFPVTSELFLFSIGHVLSRSFAGVSGSKGLSLLPGIDLLNHEDGHDHPEVISVGGDEEDRCICVSSMFEREWRALKSGSELFISYYDWKSKQGSEVEALRCFLNHGFVFKELW